MQNLFQVVLPQEWAGRLTAHVTVNYLATIVQVLLIPAAIVLAVALGRRLVSTGYWILILPWVCNIAACPVHRHRTAVAVGLHGCPVHLPHTLPGGAFIVASILTLFRATRQLLVTVTLSTAVLVGVWVVLVPTIPHPA